MTGLDVDLTQGWLVHGSQALALAAIVAAVVFWPGRKGWRRHWTLALTLLARVLTLAVVLLLSFSAVAITLNDRFGVVTNWSDLVGLAQAGGGDDPGTPGNPVDEGKLTSFPAVKGLRSHLTGRVDVWTPPGYESHRNTRTYPVLVALHGWPGNPRFLENNIRLLPAVEQAVKAHQMAWPIVVMPQWGAGGQDTECTDSPGRLDETWLATDVPLWLKANYRVRKGADNWATYGYSAGAFCSRMLTMKHPGTFGADIDLSGYSSPDFGSHFVPFAPSSPQGQAYDLIDKARIDPPSAAFYLMVDPRDTSPGEGSSYPSTIAFKQAAQSPMRVTWVETTGGHTVAAWNPQTALAMAWLGHTLKGFRP